MKTLRLAIIALTLCIASAGMARAQEKISAPMKYKGWSEKLYKDYVRTSQYVEMTDGVKLAVDVYLPRKGPQREAFPVVVEYTPYSRAYANPGFKPLEKTQGKNMLGGKGAIVPMPFSFDMGLIENGYALVIADIRGSGASQGSRFDMSPQIGKDGANLINWIAAQKWCDGNIGMKGGSYMAISQILTAAEKPKNLKAIFLMVYPFGYQDLYIGGVYNQGFMTSFSELLSAMNLNKSVKVGNFPLMPCAPVDDEDGDGSILDEIPLDLNKNGSFLDDYKYPEDPTDEPKYEDGAKRTHTYFLAVKDHEKNIPINEWVSKASFIDTTSADLGLESRYGKFNGYGISPISRIPEIMKLGIPIYHVGGWFDAQVKSTATFFATARETNPSKLLMIPVYHIMMSPYIKYFGESDSAITQGVKTETLRFFDKYLKGVDNGIDREPPVTLYVMGGGFRQENAWPLERQKETTFYFSEGNALALSPGKPGADRFKADLTHNSGFGPDMGNRWKMYVLFDKVPDRAELDKKCMTYTTAPLDADTEVTGHPIVDIWVTSSAPDSDFFVYLEDVGPDGSAVLVTEQPQRAGFASAERDNDMVINRGASDVNVLPDLPWHGYEKADYNPKIFEGGKPVRVRFDLQPTSWVFKKGHGIRVSIAAADWPTFPLNPAVSPSGKPDDPAAVAPEITFLRDADHKSGIILPVISGK